MMTGGNQPQDISSYLRTAHDKIIQAQQKVDNRDMNEQQLLEQALDAIIHAQSTISGSMQ